MKKDCRAAGIPAGAAAFCVLPDPGRRERPPVHSGGCSLGWENPWVSFTLNGEGMSDRWTTNEHFDGTHVSGYFEIGFTAWRNFQLRLGKGKRAHQLGCRIDVRNLLDHQYEIVKLYPMPGINWNFSVNYNL